MATGTLLDFAKVALADTLLAGQSLGTFAIATEGTTSAIFADVAFGAGHIVVDISITIVVLAVTDFLLRTRSGTTGPDTTAAIDDTGSTIVATGLD